MLVIALFNRTTLYLDKRRIKGTERKTSPISRRMRDDLSFIEASFTLITLSAKGDESLYLDPRYRTFLFFL